MSPLEDIARTLLLAAIGIATNTGAPAQVSDNTGKQVSLVQQLASYTDIGMLPQYAANTILVQTSSYDTTGGNNDGFNGTYSFLRKDKDSNLVIFEVAGPGVINRIWTPTPTNDTLDFFLDNDSAPSFSIRYADLFSNKIYPFIAPLCGNELGGFYCYLPIPFQTHCKIVCRARETKFHQVQCRRYPAGTTVQRFNINLDAREKAILASIVNKWSSDNIAVEQLFPVERKLRTQVAAVTLSPGETRTAFNITAPGRILAIALDNASGLERLKNLVDLKITWDDENNPAVFCPITDFFGYSAGKRSMAALLLGTRDDHNYCYLPMPFDRKARIELIYRKGAGANAGPVRLTIKLVYSDRPRNVASEGKFYSCWNSNELRAFQPSHVFLNTSGKGHYVGSMLWAQGLQAGMTYFFEGDDSTATDGLFRMHGTGSEDYFNGGWYAFPDRWSRKLSLPLHGALDYSLPFSRTGAYRFYLADKIPFEQKIYQSIEHGPERNNMPVHYTSLAFYYCDRPPQRTLAPSNERTKLYYPDTLMLYPQLMNFNVWDNISCKANWSYPTGGQTFTFTATGESRLKIALDEIPDGRYRIYADLVKQENGCRFSLWQGQKQLSDWIDTDKKGQEERVPLLYAGDVDIREFHRTLTLQFQEAGSTAELRLSRLVFVRY